MDGDRVTKVLVTGYLEEYGRGRYSQLPYLASSNFRSTRFLHWSPGARSVPSGTCTHPVSERGSAFASFHFVNIPIPNHNFVNSTL